MLDLQKIHTDHTAKPELGGGTETSQLWFQTKQSVTSNTVQIYGGEVMCEVSCFSTHSPLDRRSVMKSHLKKELFGANAQLLRYLICLPSASVMAVTAGRYICLSSNCVCSWEGWKLHVAQKDFPSAQLGRLGCLLACINFWLPRA